jgi:hypothetical protein
MVRIAESTRATHTLNESARPIRYAYITGGYKVRAYAGVSTGRFAWAQATMPPDMDRTFR